MSKAPKPAPAAIKSPFKDAQRASLGELDVLATIINEIPAIRALVLDRLRSAKARQARNTAPSIE